MACIAVLVSTSLTLPKRCSELRPIWSRYISRAGQTHNSDNSEAEMPDRANRSEMSIREDGKLVSLVELAAVVAGSGSVKWKDREQPVEAVRCEQKSKTN